MGDGFILALDDLIMKCKYSLGTGSFLALDSACDALGME